MYPAKPSIAITSTARANSVGWAASQPLSAALIDRHQVKQPYRTVLSATGMRSMINVTNPSTPPRRGVQRCSSTPITHTSASRSGRRVSSLRHWLPRWCGRRVSEPVSSPAKAPTSTQRHDPLRRYPPATSASSFTTSRHCSRAAVAARNRRTRQFV